MKLTLPSFFTSLFLSRLADQMLLFVVPLVVFQATRSVAWSGFAFFVETLPRFLAFPVCGALCDRHSPLRLLRVSQWLRAAACIAGIAGNAAFSGVGWLIALSAATGVLTTQGMMAREVMFPHILARDAFQRGLAHAQAADQAGAVLGPVLAVALLGWTRWEGAVAAAAVLFLAADLALAFWVRTGRVALPLPRQRAASVIGAVRTALLHVRDVPGLARLVALAAGVNLVIGVTLASSAALVTGLHQRGAAYYAGLQTAGAVATIVILLAVAHARLPLRALGRTSYLLVCAGGVLTAVAPTHWIYAGGFLLVVGFDKMFNIFVRTSRQRIIPVADFGKTTGVVIMLNNLTQPLAGLLIGLASTPGQTTWVVLALSALMAAIGIAAAYRWPGFQAGSEADAAG